MVGWRVGVGGNGVEVGLGLVGDAVKMMLDGRRIVGWLDGS